jgi:hypothetical protein
MAEVAPGTAKIFYVVWVLVASIIFINLLVAMMGDSYGEYGTALSPL